MKISINQQVPGRGFSQKKLADFVLVKNWKETLVSDCRLCCIFPDEPVKVRLVDLFANNLNYHSGSSHKNLVRKHHGVCLVRKPSAQVPQCTGVASLPGEVSTEATGNQHLCLADGTLSRNWLMDGCSMLFLHPHMEIRGNLTHPHIGTVS